jgi:hypothetical protein
MMPQSSFMVLATVHPQREAELRRLLSSMNDGPGRLKADTPLVPFQRFDSLHVARFVMLDDKTLADIRLYGIAPRTYPISLVFLGDVDGEADAFLADVASRAADGLRTIFACCDGFTPTTDLLAWMRAHSVGAAANYVNWRGRTVQRIREGAALHDAVQAHIRANASTLQRLSPYEIRARLCALVKADVAAERIRLSPEQPTPTGWRLRNWLHLVGVPLVLLLASPLLIILGVIGLIRLRQLEQSDPEFCPRTDPAVAAELSSQEDHDVANQFNALGSLKPGVVRLWTMIFILWAIDYTARHIYTRGRLARVRTIHFARWVFLNDKQRVLFASNYDGSLESYMDDFINKVGFGLNVAFCNGIGYPRTKWLFLDGCSDERNFKELLRRHQLPTQVWYKAYPGLTAIDLERHVRIRHGVEAASMSDREIRAWVALL